MQEKVVCPMCKHLGFKSLVYEIDWQSHLQQMEDIIMKMGIMLNLILDPSNTAIKSFWCTYGHFWIQTK